MNLKKSTILLSSLLFATPALAADSASHTVTVTVEAINEVEISGGNVTLTIDSATAGADPDPVSDSTTADLSWSTNETNKKITVQSDQAAPKYTLTVSAGNVSGGTAAGPVEVSTSAQDFVTGIATTNGSADLEYQAAATTAAGAGSDIHTITYTITDGA